jgi:hypothetical protein
MSTRCARYRILLVALLFGLVAVSGCGDGRTYPVQGKVVYLEDGSPFPGGLIVFDPVDESMPRVGPRGEIQPDGSFRISTYRDEDGAPEGTYRVLIVPPPPTGSRTRPDRRVIDPRYSTFESSGLECKVRREKNEVTFSVEKPADPVMPLPPPPPEN